ncbi:MAG: hypothetical protein K2P84_11240 [Undibacterium sp.]|nr:hypothetical protein [Undibacterium sp.]
MTTKKNAHANYDYTATVRVQRERDALKEAGGARVEAMLDAEDLARLDALIESGVVSSRRAGLKFAVQQLPLLKKPKKK